LAQLHNDSINSWWCSGYEPAGLFATPFIITLPSPHFSLFFPLSNWAIAQLNN